MPITNANNIVKVGMKAFILYPRTRSVATIDVTTETLEAIANALDQQDWILFRGPPYSWVRGNNIHGHNAGMLSAAADAPESEPGFTWTPCRARFGSRMRGVTVYVTKTPISTDELLTYITWDQT